MTLNVSAIYDHGILHPCRPLPLSDGTAVELIVTPSKPDSEHKTAAEIVSDIAALPPEQDIDKRSGRDHDRILYGEKGAR